MQKMKLLIDKKSSKKGMYAKKDEIVTIIAKHGEVWIAETENNVRFSIKQHFLTDI